MAAAGTRASEPGAIAGAAFFVFEGVDVLLVPVPDPEDEGVPEGCDEDPPTSAERSESVVKDTWMVPFVQVGPGDPVPETKFTDAHCPASARRVL